MIFSHVFELCNLISKFNKFKRKILYFSRQSQKGGHQSHKRNDLIFIPTHLALVILYSYFRLLENGLATTNGKPREKTWWVRVREKWKETKKKEKDLFKRRLKIQQRNKTKKKMKSGISKKKFLLFCIIINWEKNLRFFFLFLFSSCSSSGKPVRCWRKKARVINKKERG